MARHDNAAPGKLRSRVPAARVKKKVPPVQPVIKVMNPKKAEARLARVLQRPGEVDASVLDRLVDTIRARRNADPAISHSARLMSRGTAKIAQKFGEEAVECLIEAVAGNRTALIAESADVLYHLLVLWVDAGLSPAEVWEELHRREGISGIAEKAQRRVVIPGATSKIP